MKSESVRANLMGQYWNSVTVRNLNSIFSDDRKILPTTVLFLLMMVATALKSRSVANFYKITNFYHFHVGHFNSFLKSIDFHFLNMHFSGDYVTYLK